MKRQWCIFGLVLILFGPFLRPAQAKQDLLALLTELTQDQVLDKAEYQRLKALKPSSFPRIERNLLKHFVGFLEQHSQRIELTYTYEAQPVRVFRFLFTPSYSEAELLQGLQGKDLLAHISQQDALASTRSDSHRCGAAALLAAHYLSFGSFQAAFKALNLPANAALSYQQLHLAQEQLYNRVNTAPDGLTTAHTYQITADGRITEIKAQGEIQQAAALLKLQVMPILGPTRDRLLERETQIQSFQAQHPQAPFLVGVFLQTDTGKIRPPAPPQYPQNHFVLIFKQGSAYWLYNSGALDNGASQAIQGLNATDLNSFLYQSKASIDGLLPQP